MLPGQIIMARPADRQVRGRRAVAAPVAQLGGRSPTTEPRRQARAKPAITPSSRRIHPGVTINLTSPKPMASLRKTYAATTAPPRTRPVPPPCLPERTRGVDPGVEDQSGRRANTSATTHRGRRGPWRAGSRGGTCGSPRGQLPVETVTHIRGRRRRRAQHDQAHAGGGPQHRRQLRRGPLEGPRATQRLGR